MVLNDIVEVIKHSEYLQRFIIRWAIIIFMTFFIHGMIVRYHTRTACKALLQMYVTNGKLNIEIDPVTNMIDLQQDDRCGDPYKLKVIMINNKKTVIIYSVNGGNASTRIN